MSWEEEVEPGTSGREGFYEQGDHLGDVSGSGVAEVDFGGWHYGLLQVSGVLCCYYLGRYSCSIVGGQNDGSNKSIDKLEGRKLF